ncbi:hypothetical protein ACHAWO_005578 [Cyclotella atomus]|uniref:Calmodulin-lysine N-methyltransferase n=1 Tax=Cyclotella atomus TaxID=382360 RepID=A0ABD3NK23_9STRA
MKTIINDLPIEHELIKDASFEEGDNPDPFLQQMSRGEYLRQLRMMALQDEMERAQEDEVPEEKCDLHLVAHTDAMEEVQTLPTGERMLHYPTYLSHQRYYDDLKHVDMHYINYGLIGSSTKPDAADNEFDREIYRVESSNDVRNVDVNSSIHVAPTTTQETSGGLIVEQRKSLGKGGFCWDAAFILGEHVIHNENEWNQKKTTVLELGSGTGLCGLMVAKATDARVTITDLPELLGLMQDNLQRNHPYKSSVEARTLRWSCEEDYNGAPYDVIIGADIVASLYDPVALAGTLHALAGPNTKVYISAKSRLDKPHEEFDEEMERLFERCERVCEPDSRLKNPHVFVMRFEGKREL